MDADFDHSVYFYTYSTIAQVLAAVFSILVAAVVFRIQEIASRVSHFARQVIASSPADPRRLKQIEARGQWHELVSLHAGANQVNPALSREENEVLDLHFQHLRHSLLLMDRIRQALFASLYATGPAILGAIAAMPITHFFLAPRSPIAVALLTASILSAAYCLWNYFRPMLNVFEN